MKTIAIDFDGTICKKQPYGDGEIYEEPNAGAKEIMKQLKIAGYKLVIFTTRLNPTLTGEISVKKERIEKWLAKHEIPYDLLTNNKPAAFAYVDDRAIRFTNWHDIGNYFIS